MSTYLDIRSALQKHLQDYLATLGSAAPPVNWPNREFNPVIGTLWLKPVLLMAKAKVAEIGVNGQKYQQGIYQISVYSPKDIGDDSALTTADALVEWYQDGTVLAFNTVSGLIVNVAYIGPPIIENDWYHIPVSASFFVFTSN